jgi:molecular chaperone GrpE
MDDKRDIEIKTSEEAEEEQDTPAAEDAAEELTETQEGESTAGDIPEVDETGQLKEQIAELEDKLLRSRAELDNYRKRAARQQQQAVEAAREGIINELLEIVDNFERAAEHADGEADAAALKSGMDMIHNQFKSFLRKYDIAPIESVGKPFDPSLHEALMQVESDEHPEGTVVNELSRGYKIGDKVLRYAKVGVSRGPSEESDEDED